MKLAVNALTKALCGLVLIGLTLFLPAGTLFYPNAWLFIGLLFIPMTLIAVFLLFRSPELLKKRLSTKEKEGTQKAVVAFSALIFPAGFIISALDHRFCLSSVPLWLTVTASVLFLLGYAAYGEVMRENAYLSRTVEVRDGQKLISSGLYSLVRHPMYLATLFMFLPIPLILGSFWGLIPFSLYPVVIAFRIINEEKVLDRGLSGYGDYKKKVKYRLIPFIW